MIPLITTAEAEGAIEMLYAFVGVGSGPGLKSSLLDGVVGPMPKALVMRAANPGTFEEDEVGLCCGDSAL